MGVFAAPSPSLYSPCWSEHLPLSYLAHTILQGSQQHKYWRGGLELANHTQGRTLLPISGYASVFGWFLGTVKRFPLQRYSFHNGSQYACCYLLWYRTAVAPALVRHLCMYLCFWCAYT